MLVPQYSLVLLLFCSCTPVAMLDLPTASTEPQTRSFAQTSQAPFQLSSLCHRHLSSQRLGRVLSFTGRISGSDGYRSNLYQPGPCYICTMHLVTQTRPRGKVLPAFPFSRSQVQFPEMKCSILFHRFLSPSQPAPSTGRQQTFGFLYW